MTHPFATPGHRRVCACGAEVVRVYTRTPSMNCDLDPTPTRSATATGPYFRRLTDDTYLQINAIDAVGGVAGVPAGATLACHHCAPPAMCRWCQQVHEVVA